MTESIKVKTVQEAWNEANRLMPNDYEYDTESSTRAGYAIYRSNVEHYDYICDLGERLEVNLFKDGKTVNIWIKKEEKSMEKLEDMLRITKMKIEIEQEKIDRCMKEIKDSAQNDKPYHIAMFMPGYIGELQEAMDKKKKYEEQVDMLEYLKKDEGER